MNEKDKERLIKLIAKNAIPEMINSLHRDGVITDEELNDRGIVMRKVRKQLGKVHFDIVVDHRKTLLMYAEEANKAENQELAIALYATCVEHSLNRIIHTECINKKIDSKTKTDILRTVNLMGKCTWLISLLGLPKIKEDYVKMIQQISEQRNSYFHYKWNPEPDSDKVPDPDRKREMHLGNIKKMKVLLKYLNSYNSRRAFRGKKATIHKHV